MQHSWMHSFLAGTVERRPDLVFADKDGISVIYGGRAAKISLRSSATEDASIVMISKGSETKLMTGPAASVADVYGRVTNELLRPKRPIPWKLFAAGVFAGALAMHASDRISGSTERVEQAVELDASARLQEMANELMRRRQELGVHGTPQISGAAGAPIPDGLRPFASGTQVLPRPDFLKIPEMTPSDPVAVAPKNLPTEQSADARRPQADEEVQPEEPAKSAEQVIAERLAAATDALDAAGKKASETIGATSSKEGTGSSESGQRSSAPPEETQERTAPNEAEEGTGSTSGTAEQSKLKDKVGQLVKDMSTDEKMRILAQLDEIGGGEITPEILSSLPHEVARILIEAGLVARPTENPDAPGGTPYRIIRLPERVLEKYRGKDGIASIPEANTWAATGNYVSLPLPGGGDIKLPEHMKEFGLNP